MTIRPETDPAGHGHLIVADGCTRHHAQLSVEAAVPVGAAGSAVHLLYQLAQPLPAQF